MANFTRKRNTTLYIEEESTEGTPVDPTSGASAILPIADSIEMAPNVENVERNVQNSSIGKSTPRKGMRSVSGGVSVEFKAHGTEGTAPEYGLMLESLLGNTRSAAADAVDAYVDADTITVTGHGYSTGDVVMIKHAGAYHITPVVVVDANTLDLVVSDPVASGTPAISALTTYYPADSGHKSITFTKYVEDAIEEQGIGCKMASAGLSNFTTGQIPQLDFGFEGLNHTREVKAPTYTPSYDSALSPVALDACIFVDGVAVEVSEISFSVENVLGGIMDVCDANGKSAQLVNERTITGSINLYKKDNSVDTYNKLVNGTVFSVFGYAKIPTGTDGEHQDVVAVYLPNIQISELGEGDVDGTLQDVVSFTATRGTDGSEDEIFISFI